MFVLHSRITQPLCAVIPVKGDEKWELLSKVIEKLETRETKKVLAPADNSHHLFMTGSGIGLYLLLISLANSLSFLSMTAELPACL